MTCFRHGFQDRESRFSLFGLLFYFSIEVKANSF
ncbi:unnamed protein product [Arabidopsis halleri]